MLRIDQSQEGETTIIRVEGRVAGLWVEELRRVLASLEGDPSSVALDLASVGYVDAPGEQLLRDAAARGVRIRDRSSFVAALLEARPSGGPR
jgi:hypothetical protein